MQAFIHCWFDYCNAIAYWREQPTFRQNGCNQYKIPRLTWYQEYDVDTRIIPILSTLHWLLVRPKIVFKTAILV